ncbi:MAG: ATP-grasp domain-containing protein, partial [Halobacteriovoraceae bacterium]|nr:ATP-grasp domain-containing protein [Halobacteriovoraceae bacterium]
MKRVLITGARSPAALEWCRILHSCGCGVFLVDSLDVCIAKYSNSIQKFIKISSPRFHFERFRSDLTDLIDREKIDLIIPTCEEVFFLVQAMKVQPRLSKLLFADSERVTHRLHSKFEFISWARDLGLAVPETERIPRRDDLQKMDLNTNNWVLKPEFSRFASDTVLNKKELNHWMKKRKWTRQNWIRQRKIKGEEFSSYGICVNGDIKLHVVYKSLFRAGKGAGIAIKKANIPTIEKWVYSFVKKISYTGQIAFDFILTDDGRALAIECNPRATTGIHFWARAPHLVGNALFNSNPPSLSSHLGYGPTTADSIILKPIMWSYG